MTFYVNLSSVTADIKACLNISTSPTPQSQLQLTTMSSSPPAMYFHAANDYLSIDTDLRSFLNMCFQAAHFDTLLHSLRWADIVRLHDDKRIDWPATWAFFNYKHNMSKSQTSFSQSSMTTFAVKLLLEELPVMENLKRRRPDLYPANQTCPLCHNNVPEDLKHLWFCPYFATESTLLISKTKEHFFTQLSALNTKNRPINFDSIGTLSCWNRDRSAATRLDFVLLFRGFIPLDLTNSLPKCIKKQDALNALFSTLTSTRATFRLHIWLPRCEQVTKFEEARNISRSDKFSRYNSSTTSRSATSKTHSLSHLSGNWKSWIERSIRSGSDDWLGFLEGINSKFLSLTNALIYLVTIFR